MELNELEELVEHHNDLYWNKNSPEISDPEYDNLCRQLAELDPDNQLLGKVHPSIHKEKTFTHKKPMLSLQKAYTKEEIISWAEGVSRGSYELFRIGPKLDGCAAEVGADYIATRGDGEVGELVTDKSPIINYLPSEGYPVRGEIVVLKYNLQGLSRSDGTPYKTCRSAAAGILNQNTLPSRICLTFIPHSISIMGKFSIDKLRELDFEALMDHEAGKGYPVDGLVVSLVDQDYAETLGMTGHHPRHSIAYKMKNPETISKVIGVEWQVSKTRIAPVAILEPTELDGVTIERATLHNLQQIARLGVMIGSEVKLVRAGSVIPAITEVISNEGASPIQIPIECPSCGHPTDNDGQDISCSNSRCGGIHAKLLQDALARLDIENCGPAVCSELVRLGFITASTVLCLGIEDWLKLEGFAEKSAKAMYDQMQKRIQTPIEDYKILAAMNFPGIGITLSKRIMAEFNILALDFADLSAVEGMGAGRASSINLGSEWDKLCAMLKPIQTRGTQTENKPTVCFTGSNPEPRSFWIKLAEEKGFDFNKSVTKDMTYLVCDDVNSNSGKTKKAKGYGVQIITYEEFVKL